MTYLYIITIADCKAVITFNQGLRGGRVIELKKTVDEAVKSCPSIKHVFVAQRTDNKVDMGNLDISLEEVRRIHVYLYYVTWCTWNGRICVIYCMFCRDNDDYTK